MAVLKIENLTKKFGDFYAVNDLSFEVAKNHVVGFLGPNGAGKTTTLRMLVGLSNPTKGNINIFDNDLVFGDNQSRKKVGYLPEQPSLYPWMTGYEYLSFIADIFNMSQSKKAKKISELLETVDLKEAKNKKIGTYSNGMKQRLGIAQSIINDPELIILDEPVSALDPIGRKEVLKIIEKLKSKATILFSTHILSDVDKVCDDVILLNKGKLVVSSPISELKAKYTTLILEVEFVKDPNEIVKDLKEQKWVKRMDKNGNHIKIWITGTNVIDDNTSLKYFAKQSIGITKYGLILPEVEDLFLDLLKENNA